MLHLSTYIQYVSLTTAELTYYIVFKYIYDRFFMFVALILCSHMVSLAMIYQSLSRLLSALSIHHSDSVMCREVLL